MRGYTVLKMIDNETGLTMTMGVQAQPQNPRLAENNLFQIVTWTKGLGDTHKWRTHEDFLSCIKTQDHLIYRLRKGESARHTVLTVLHGTEAPVIGYAFAHYDLLRLEFDQPGDIGPDEVKRALDLLMVELLTYEEYVTGQVYSFTITDKAGVILERRDNIYGEDYAEYLAREALDKHRLGVDAREG